MRKFKVWITDRENGGIAETILFEPMPPSGMALSTWRESQEYTYACISLLRELRKLVSNTTVITAVLPQFLQGILSPANEKTGQ